ncbi:NAD(+) kinase [Porticoccus sp. W117]|uniref:NAD(+) kinase n=1 Tax=Porticoccus sp. W117 TaxID=3054777 RepID=UPI0025992A9A|nr:NAD(+) kinase [Porticoccus sp. W117]MDM3870313.1 NAD(+) kinase [Porticoccus sp. W117]
MPSFPRIGLMARVQYPEVVDSLRYLISDLGADHSLMVEARAAAFLKEESLDDEGIDYPVCECQEFADCIDLAILVGGDGSMLSAAREMVDFDVPLLGINRGRLGFLNDIYPDEIGPRVREVLAGNYIESSRFLLETAVTRNGTEIGAGIALNDVVLHPGQSVRMMEFELYIDGHFVNSQRSDGLIVATPTGSTAYALSGGGPILNPDLDAIVLVPMNPHTLSSRPIVVPGNSEIEIRVSDLNELHPFVTCDGQNHVETEPGDVISIRKKAKQLRLIHPSDHNFYEICRSKLGWGSRVGAIHRNNKNP